MVDMAFIDCYALVMKILGLIIIFFGSFVLYLVFQHSHRTGKSYKRALRLHVALLFVSHSFLCICYIPAIVNPYIAIFANGYLMNAVPGIVLLVFQLTLFLTSLTSVGMLFHLRLIAVLPHHHFLRKRIVFYIGSLCYYIPSIICTPGCLFFNYMGQENVKKDLVTEMGINDTMLYDPRTAALNLKSQSGMVYIATLGIGAIAFVGFSCSVSYWILARLDHHRNDMSDRTRSVQKKLTISLIVQTSSYNLFFFGSAFAILILVIIGKGETVVISILFWIFSCSFLFSGISMIVTNKGYKDVTLRYVFRLTCRSNKVHEIDARIKSTARTTVVTVY